MRKRGTLGHDEPWVFRHMGKIMAAWLVVLVLFFSWMGYLAVQFAGEVEEKGLKPLLEEVWEGPEQ